MTKVELYQLVKQNKGDPIYEIDQLLHAHGHTVLRLPPYHCDLSPIELIWSQIKGRVARDNCNFTVAGILQATQSSINQVTTENWLKCCEHVMTVEHEYKKNDGVVIPRVETCVIDVGALSASSESSSDSYSDSSSDSCSDYTSDSSSECSDD